MVESAGHYVYDAAGNIASRQVETPGAASVMTPYSHNSLNQITALGGSSGARTVSVRGSTSEAAKVKACINHDVCVRDGLCYIACRDGGHQAISLNDDRLPIVDTDKCVGCGLCRVICPVKDCIG